jgi:hypothetical protein
MARCDNTGESLAFTLRAGSAGANTVVDHLEVLDAAIAQIPAGHRRGSAGHRDGAGASHGLVDHITTLNAKPGRRVHYLVGCDLGERERVAIGRMPAHAWQPALDAQGHARPLAEAAVVELTALLRQHPAGGCAGRGCCASTDLWPSRTQDAALPAAAHRRPHRSALVGRSSRSPRSLLILADPVAQRRDAPPTARPTGGSPAWGLTPGTTAPREPSARRGTSSVMPRMTSLRSIRP